MLNSKVLNIGIYGVGLIGGSLGLALKKFNSSRKKIKYRIIGIGRDPRKLKLAQSLGAVDVYSSDPYFYAKELDILVLAMRVDLIASFARKMSEFLPKNSIVTDVGSVKGMIADKLRQGLLKDNIYFVPAHPIAGLEKTGVRNASGSMYEGSYTVLCPMRGLPLEIYNLVKNMWRDAGSKIIELDPYLHDKILCATSHMPHILSMGLLNILSKSIIKYPQVKSLTAGSFRDITRISDSDPQSWAEICQANRKELLSAVEEYIKLLKAVKSKLENNISLENLFKKARDTRNLCLSSTRETK